MRNLSAHQSDAVRRVEEAFGAEAREVELGVPEGFGRQQVLSHLAGTLFGPRRVLVVVSHPARVAQAFESGLGQSGGRRVGLVLSDSDVEVASLSQALRLAREGRLSHGAVILDGLRPDQSEAETDLLRHRPDLPVLRLRDGAEAGAGYAFPVRVLATNADAPGPAGP